MEIPRVDERAASLRYQYRKIGIVMETLPDFTETGLSRYLEKCAAEFDAETGLLGGEWQGPGYHSTVPNGTFVHRTRENFGYALALFADGREPGLARAEAILDKLLPLQDQEMASPTYGLWPWLWEEPLQKMSPPDWNWADFCGIRLAHLLCLYGDRLDAELRGRIEAAVRAAAYCIFRRNVQPVYTNIAVKGGVVAAVAGELLGEGTLLDYARARLGRFVEYTRRMGGFTEYNSPAYGVLVLTEVERGLFLVKDPEVRDRLREIHALCWQMFAQTFHRPTGQICGPHSRVYSDLLGSETTKIFEEALGISLGQTSLDPDYALTGDLILIPRVRCPDEIKRTMYEGPAEAFQTITYVPSEEPLRCRVASVWMAESACLGSINVENMWTQRRPVLGYWKADGQIAVLRVRLLNDGRDFASGIIRTAQARNALLGLVTLATNKGDFHDHLDIPKGGVFSVSDLQLAIEVQAPRWRIIEKSQSLFVISVGGRRVQVKPLLEVFGIFPVDWKIREGAGKVSVCAEINEEKPFELRPAELAEAVLGFHLALLSGHEEPCPGSISITKSGEIVRAGFEHANYSLALEAPLAPERFI